MRFRSPQGVTLIELLVVISIIALLIGILVPVIASVQRSARLSACLSNVNQITMAIDAAMRERDRIYPGPSQGSDDLQMGLLGTSGTSGQMGGNRPADQRPLNRYLSEVEQIAQCPLDQGGMGGSDPVHQRLGTSYWYPASPQNTQQYYTQDNVWLFGGRPGGRREVSNPARKLVIADAVVLGSRFPAGESRNDWHGSGEPLGITVGFADGNAKQLERKGSGSQGPESVGRNTIDGMAGQDSYY